MFIPLVLTSASPSRQEELVQTPPVRKRPTTPPNHDDENMFVPLPPVIPRETSERKQIKIELAKSVPLPPSTPPGNNCIGHERLEMIEHD
jgi:hypothetical protein